MKEEEITIEQDIAKVCSTAEGRRVIWEFLSFCDLYAEAGNDPHTSLVLNGRRSVGLRMLEVLHSVDPTIYIRMQEEHI